MPKLMNLIGQRYGKLVCEGRSDKRDAKGRQPFEVVRCDCGVVKTVIRGDLPKLKSCGCARGALIAAAKTKHGHGTGSPTYKSWSAMIQRCESPKNKSYHRYGGRGIVVCERWRNSFSAFLDDMGEKPPNKTLDREDNDGNYEKSNCRWATAKEQGRTNYHLRLVAAFGRIMPLGDWAVEVGIERETVAVRLNAGWPPERALSVDPNGADAGWEKGRRRRVMVSAFGKVQHIAAWSRETGLPYGVIAYRLRHNWNIERALTEKVGVTGQWQTRQIMMERNLVTYRLLDDGATSEMEPA